MKRSNQEVFSKIKMKNNRKIIKWKSSIEEIVKDVSDLVESRYIFNEIVSVCKDNEELKKENMFWRVFKMNYVSSAIVGICKQIDERKDILSLIKLLKEISTNPEIITKKWFIFQYQKNRGEIDNQTMRDQAKIDFEEKFGKGDFIERSIVSSDISKIECCTEIIQTLRHKRIAHKNKNLKLEFNVSFNDLDQAIDILEHVTIKYNLLLDQSWYNTLLPVVDDWQKIFKSPWIFK